MQLRDPYIFVKETATQVVYRIPDKMNGGVYPHDYREKKALHLGGPLHNEIVAPRVTLGSEHYYFYQRHAGGDGVPNRRIYIYKNVVDGSCQL